MKITDKRAAKVDLTNGTGASVSFLIIPLSAIVDNNGSETIASDRTEKIVVASAANTLIDIPAGYRIGVVQDIEFACRRLGEDFDMTLIPIGDYSEPGDIIYNVTAECVKQGDIIHADVNDPA